MAVDIINLQLFAEEKTEKATPKKRREARRKGQVARSTEINSAAVMLAVCIVLKLTFFSILEGLQKSYYTFLYITGPLEDVYTLSGLRLTEINSLKTVGAAFAPVFAIAVVAGLLANYGQIGFLFTAAPLSPRLNRINPVEGFKRIFSKRALVEFLKAIFKMLIIGFVVYSEFLRIIGDIPGLIEVNIVQGVLFLADRIFTVALKSLLALMVIAIFDYLYQRWEHEKSLRMTKQEIKDEYKQTEGDPQIRSRIREKQRQISMRRMMQDVPKADVVITNPVHLAVALRYNPEENDAPVVLAKGKNYLAIKIKEIAQKNNVVVVENKPLAQALYQSTDVGQAIPPELYHAVAEVLAFVYKLKGEIK